jgi:erythronate-4-phosphate dehydrogenase
MTRMTGSNANSVREYVASALLELAVKRGWSLKGASIGIVGVGHVGSKVRSAAEALGMQVLQNDPLLARETGDRRFVPLDELMDADVITLHVPLTKNGPDATHHLFDEKRFAQMKRGSIIINTSRGSVVRSEALKGALVSKQLGASVIDVWENEPDIDVELFGSVTIGTPHIAGYSVEGKTNAVSMIRDALCRHFGIAAALRPLTDAQSRDARELDIPSGNLTAESVLHHIISKSYDIAMDDRLLRGIAGRPPGARGAYFSNLRSGYRERHEFGNTTVRLPKRYEHLAGAIAALGFRCSIVESDANRGGNQQGMSNREKIIQ